MICIKTNDRTYGYYKPNRLIKIIANYSDMHFQNECLDNGTVFLNSTKLLNLLKNELSKINNYKKANIHKNKEAVTLKLKSYKWNFDIVPCFLQHQNIIIIINNII